MDNIFRQETKIIPEANIKLLFWTETNDLKYD